MISAFTKGVMMFIEKQHLTLSKGMGQLRSLPHYIVSSFTTDNFDILQLIVKPQPQHNTI